jgi:hypothetical protein
LERKEFFDTLTARLHPDDFHLQLAAVVELAKYGKDLSGFHYEAIPLLTKWLRQSWDAVENARQQSRQVPSKPGQVKAPIGEETNLHQLFNFVVDVIGFSSVVFTEDETGKLIDEALYIALQAKRPEEIQDSVRVLDAIVIYSAIPPDKLPECIKVLCLIHFIILEARKDAWHVIHNLCRSHNGNTTIGILLDILRSPVLGQVSQANIREIRGSLSVFEIIISKAREKGYPTVPFALLMDALTTVLAMEHSKPNSEVLRLILSLFNGDKDGLPEELMKEDWTPIFDIAAKCSLFASETSDGRPVHNRSGTASPACSEASRDGASNMGTSVAQMLHRFIVKIEECFSIAHGDFLQKENCIAFFARVHPHLSESCAKLVIDHYADYRLCYPSNPNWQVNVRFLLEAFFSNRSRSTEIRLQALKTITDVYEMIESMEEHQVDEDCLYKFVSGILADLAEERDVTVLQDIISYAVSLADTADPSLFEYIVNQLHHSISSDQLHLPLAPAGSRIGLLGSVAYPIGVEGQAAPATSANVVTRGFVQIFMRSMEAPSSKALRVFDEILWVAKSNSCDTDARLSAMRMLFRLRADWANRIFLTSCIECEGLASSLYRTQASLDRRQAADEVLQNYASRSNDYGGSRSVRIASSGRLHSKMDTRISRNMSGMSRPLQRNQPLWMHPDIEALPEPASGKASMSLVSIMDDVGTEDASISANSKVLKIGAWLETVTQLLQQGCDWEVYSYILVHLPSQLTNQALFRAAIPQVKQLRSVICQQIKGNSFHEPPLSSGLRKADVSICLFQTLSIVMSYRQHFSRNEEDEIVKTFTYGMSTLGTIKCCIHALSICCHELPASMTLVLANILRKMSQLITQPHVAVHILEFLACLARLPRLHSYFRDEDYRVVFGICFQYVREEEQNVRYAKNRNSGTPSQISTTPVKSSRLLGSAGAAESNLLPNASDDLPQYVYALAYHVITFWFLSLRLTERGNHVSWITKNLVWVDEFGKQQIDEQAQVTMNFIQRTTYTDVDESVADPNFTEDRFGKILKRRWLVGQSIVTIEQATHGGWAQITKRQASGTSYYMICEKFERPPADQAVNSPEALQDISDSDPNVVQPSHLLIQLVGLSPLTAESLRPIPLPDDEMMRRAISYFDRIPTADCHKVGVIYIGENQTQEAEILANVNGSGNYTKFLSGLGTLRNLQGATFNTQGLDRQYNSDGEYAFYWRDRVTEIVFHVTTLMPTNLEHDPQCSNKKRHIGNDFVNIIFNNSGNPFQFDTFHSEFNFVNIVITPESRASFVPTRLQSEPLADSAFYKVQVMSKPGLPEISPAAETKIVSLKELADFIRLLALNASVFSLVWANRAGGEHVSSWRNRLREIERLREKYGSKFASPNLPTPPSSARGSASSVGPGSSNVTHNTEMYDRASKNLSRVGTEVGTVSLEENIVEALDFSKWA